MKRVFSMLMIAILCVGLFAGCGKETSKPVSKSDLKENGAPSIAIPADANEVGMLDGFASVKEVDVPVLDWDTEEYNYVKENTFQSVKANPFATFAADVDTASYANFRRQVLHGEEVRSDSIRAEEMLNYFHYDYKEPEGNDPFGVNTEVAPCPWNDKAELLLVGLQAKPMDVEKMPRSNLVFLIDVSGSMYGGNRLPLVQRSFMTLVDTLSENDIVSIVTYASGQDIILDGVSADNKNEIMTAIEGLEANGGTYGSKAIEMAYEIAEKHFIEGGNNRIIMATDGDLNVGITSESELTRLVKEKASNGVFLSILGYGMGNYKDNKLESMADNGNGNYAYIDSIDEARKVLVDEAGGTLFTVAKDVKLQVEFNPAVVKGYRLIGYENRVMAASDFADDTKDGGEIGAGHQVTALFEIIPVGSDYEIPEVESRYGQNKTESETAFADEICTVNIRYKEPEGSESILLVYPVTKESVQEKMSKNLTWAAGVAQVAMLLTNSEYKGNSDYETIREMLKPIADDDFREEFVYLIGKLS